MSDLDYREVINSAEDILRSTNEDSHKRQKALELLRKDFGDQMSQVLTGSGKFDFYFTEENPHKVVIGRGVTWNLTPDDIRGVVLSTAEDKLGISSDKKFSEDLQDGRVKSIYSGSKAVLVSEQKFNNEGKLQSTHFVAQRVR